MRASPRFDTSLGYVGRPRPEGSRRRRVLALSAIGMLLAAPPAWAQMIAAVQPPSELKKLSLEELFDVVVTSVSKKPEPASKAAAAVRVVSGDDISRMGALSIPEALRYVPGLEVARLDSRQYAITARGFNGTVANKLLVLMDGRSVYTPLFSGVFWDAQDTFLEDVEQIEIIRGPGATVWGANAVNGVINVISKPASQTQGPLLTGGGGNSEHGFGGARFGGTLGAHGFFRVYGKRFDRDGARLLDGRSAADDFRMDQGGFRVDWTPRKADEVTFHGDLYGGTIRQRSADAIEVNGGNVVGRWTRRFSADSDLQLQAYYDRTFRDQPPTFAEGLDTYDVTLQHRFSRARRQDVVWGLDYRLTRDEVRNSVALAFMPAQVNHSLFTWFVQDEVSLAEDRLRVTLGSKFEHNDYTGFEYQPSGRVAWSPTPVHTVWGAASRAVRTPSRLDRDLFAPAAPPYLLAGGPGFDSEVLRAFELGYKVQPVRHVTASVATFRNLYDKLRSLELGPPAILANGLTGRTYGAEVSVRCDVRDGWRLNAGYTFLRLELRRTAGSTDTSQVQQEGDSPRHQGFVRSSLDLPRGVALDVALRYFDHIPHQRVPAHADCDARLGWRPIGSLELAVVGQNLLQPRHVEFGLPAARKQLERSLYGKATCTF